MGKVEKELDQRQTSIEEAEENILLSRKRLEETHHKIAKYEEDIKLEEKRLLEPEYKAVRGQYSADVVVGCCVSWGRTILMIVLRLQPDPEVVRELKDKIKTKSVEIRCVQRLESMSCGLPYVISC
mgnify:CR=1 FL=1